MDKTFLETAIRKTAEVKERSKFESIKSQFSGCYLNRLFLTIWDQKISVINLIDWSFKSPTMTTNLQELRDAEKTKIEQEETWNLLSKVENINYILQNAT